MLWPASCAGRPVLRQSLLPRSWFGRQIVCRQRNGARAHAYLELVNAFVEAAGGVMGMAEIQPTARRQDLGEKVSIEARHDALLNEVGSRRAVLQLGAASMPIKDLARQQLGPPLDDVELDVVRKARGKQSHLVLAMHRLAAEAPGK